MLNKLMNLLGVSSQAQAEPEVTYVCRDTVCGGYGRAFKCDSTGYCTPTQMCC